MTHIRPALTPNWQAVLTLFVRDRPCPYRFRGFSLEVVIFVNTMDSSGLTFINTAKGFAMKVIGYTRVSTEEQSIHGVSLEAQRAKLDAYAALYGVQVVEVIEDAGQSAKTLKRPGLQRALGMLKRGEADGLLICKLDRLSRSVKDWNALIDSHFGEKVGKQLLSVNDQIDTRSAAGRLVLNVLMSVGQWEREAIGERTRDALAFKRSKCERLGGRLPFGFSVAADGVSLIEDENEQRVLREIKELREAGHTLRAIADVLNKRNIPAKSGKLWRHTSVQSVLTRNAA
jgi:site-specific DNA recombinase